MAPSRRFAAASGNLIHGNFIGTDDAGASPLGNGGAGVRIASAAGNTVGGTVPGAGNRIALNTGAGVSATSNAGLGNAIFGNQLPLRCRGRRPT